MLKSFSLNTGALKSLVFYFKGRDKDTVLFCPLPEWLVSAVRSQTSLYINYFLT